MSTIPPTAQAKAGLLIVATLVGVQIPTTLQEIEDPIVRSILQIAAVVILTGVGWLFYRVQTKPDSFKSLRPPSMNPEEVTPEETPQAKNEDK